MESRYGERGWAPIRRPRRSVEGRSHPFRAPRLSYRDGLSGQSAVAPREPSSPPGPPPGAGGRPGGGTFWGYLRQVLSDEATPAAPPTRPRGPRLDFHPPPGEDSSEEEEEAPAPVPLDEEDELMYAEQYSPAGSSDEEGETRAEHWPRAPARRGSYGGQLSAERMDEDSPPGPSGGRVAMELSAAREHNAGLDGDEDDSEEEEDGDDEEEENGAGEEGFGAASGPRPSRPWLDTYIRQMEAAEEQSSSMARVMARAARKLYDEQFQPGGSGYEQRERPSRRVQRLTRDGMWEGDTVIVTGGFMRMDPDPNSHYGAISRLLTAPVAMNPSWEEAVENHRASFPIEADYDGYALFKSGLRPPSVLSGRMDTLAFYGVVPALYAFIDIDPDDAYDEQLAWDRTPALHGHPQVSWLVASGDYSQGGMYVTPTQEPRGVWRRALKQAMALQLRMCVGGLAEYLRKHEEVQSRAGVEFLLDAAIRTARNCHVASRLLLFAWKRRNAPPEHRPARSLVAAARTTLLRPLPAEVSELLAQREFDVGARGPASAIFRAFYGPLVYWAALRRAVRDPATINCRYVGFHVQTAEIYLLARAHTTSPGFTAEELVIMEVTLTLGALMLEVALHWLHVATAHMLAENDLLKAFRRVRASMPHARAPLGSVGLLNAEFKTLSRPDVMVARDETALGQALLLGYFSTRTALTACMRDYAGESVDGFKETRVSVYLGISLLLQRWAGHLNLLLNCLSGAAIHGGRRVAIHEQTLPRYSLMADVMAPLLQQHSLADFWRGRDDLLRGMDVTPMPGPPVQGKRVVLELPLPAEELHALTPAALVGDDDQIGNPVDLAEQLQDYRETILGDDAPAPVRSLVRAHGGVPARRGGRGSRGCPPPRP
ncbi:tegument protein VP13/14 [Equid alphaherpesvirus 3]|uniref:Tegument protein UL47 n=1 Tax=Equid alphaherpesvirus 3 TaxID=80341 RepID=A0A077B5W6_9ALPH|nr:tegument protein VP13/14 [Equid alphaherpesvirus 3]AIL02930.1 tegument protein VP13/14 [Equid alphaherpesvirus 3]BAX04356.1 tegument protein VP13/14 [Equid alphaherpesvirus 3]